ncbi:hypothetical protein AB0L64_10150 [Kribbella sp. NPDC051936]
MHYLSTVHTSPAAWGRLTSLQGGVITEAEAEEFARTLVEVHSTGR